MTRVVIVPLDGSEQAERALPWAAWLARQHDLALVLARAVPWPTLYTVAGIDAGYVPPEIYEQVLEEERQAAVAYLAEVQGRLAAEGLLVETDCRLGEPAQQILNVADERAAAAVVMTTHGRGGVARLVLGSVAERVLQQVALPLLLVRAGSAAAPTDLAAARVLVPLDGSALAERGLDLAREVVPPGARLTLLRVVRPIERLAGGGGVATTYVDQGATQDEVERAREYLIRLADSLPADRAQVETVVRLGQAADEIVAAARELDARLVVLSTHGRTGPRRWMLGSVADAVVRHSPAPVLLASARALVAQATGTATVRDIMGRASATARPTDTLLGAIQQLLRQRQSALPVVGPDGRLVGLITEADLLAWQAGELEALAREPGIATTALQQRLATETVGAIMTTDVTTVNPATPLPAAVRVFVTHDRRLLPVVEDGRLVGIVTCADVLRALAARTDAASSLQGPGDDMAAAAVGLG